MKKADRDRLDRISLLLANASRLGLNQFLLSSIVHHDVVGHIHPDNINYRALWETADMINKGGMATQLDYLMEVYGFEGVMKKLDMSCSPLDSFIRQTSSPSWPEPGLDVTQGAE
jgi:hypothetical protein